MFHPTYFICLLWFSSTLTSSDSQEVKSITAEQFYLETPVVVEKAFEITIDQMVLNKTIKFFPTLTAEYNDIIIILNSTGQLRNENDNKCFEILYGLKQKTLNDGGLFLNSPYGTYKFNMKEANYTLTVFERIPEKPFVVYYKPPKNENCPRKHSTISILGIPSYNVLESNLCPEAHKVKVYNINNRTVCIDNYTNPTIFDSLKQVGAKIEMPKEERKNSSSDIPTWLIPLICVLIIGVIVVVPVIFRKKLSEYCGCTEKKKGTSENPSGVEDGNQERIPLTENSNQKFNDPNSVNVDGNPDQNSDPHSSANRSVNDSSQSHETDETDNKQKILKKEKEIQDTEEKLNQQKTEMQDTEEKLNQQKNERQELVLLQAKLFKESADNNRKLQTINEEIENIPQSDMRQENFEELLKSKTMFQNEEKEMNELSNKIREILELSDSELKKEESQEEIENLREFSCNAISHSQSQPYPRPLLNDEKDEYIPEREPDLPNFNPVGKYVSECEFLGPVVRLYDTGGYFSPLKEYENKINSEWMRIRGGKILALIWSIPYYIKSEKCRLPPMIVRFTLQTHDDKQLKIKARLLDNNYVNKRLKFPLTFYLLIKFQDDIAKSKLHKFVFDGLKDNSNEEFISFYDKIPQDGKFQNIHFKITDSEGQP